MSVSGVVLRGVVTTDGRLEVEGRLRLPAGPVQVTVQPLPCSPGEDVMAVLRRIWAEQQARSTVPRTREQIDADLNALRDEAEEELSDLERRTEPETPRG